MALDQDEMQRIMVRASLGLPKLRGLRPELRIFQRTAYLEAAEARAANQVYTFSSDFPDLSEEGERPFG